MSKVTLWRVLLGLVLCATPAFPQEFYNVATYMRIKKGTDQSLKTVMQVYIRGLGEGIAWMNTDARQYCQPETLSLNEGNLEDVIDRELIRLSAMVEAGIRSQSEADGMPLGVILKAGLRNTFPCKDSQNPRPKK